MIYIISGKKFSGKDTVASYISKRTTLPIFNYAEKIRSVIKHTFNLSDCFFSGEAKESKILRLFDYKPAVSSIEGLKISLDNYKEFSVRNIMQDLGNYFRNNFSKNFWVDALINDLDKNKINDFILSDARYVNEIEEIIKKYGKDNVCSIRVTRTSDQRFQETSEDISETSLDSYKNFDYYIDNNFTLEELYLKVDAILLKSN